MGGAATVRREGVAINIHLQPYVILLFMEIFFVLKEKTSTKTKNGKT